MSFSDNTYHQLTTAELGRKYYSSADIVTINLNSSGVPSGITKDESGELVVLFCSWINNSDSDVTITAVDTTFSSLFTYNGWNITGFRYGFISLHPTPL